MLYATPAPEEPLSQGDILDACPIFGLEVPATGVDLDAAPARWQERVVVLAQACDLAQTKTSKVLVALLQPAQILVDQGILKAPVIRDQLRRGLVYGWYFLPEMDDVVTVNLRDGGSTFERLDPKGRKDWLEEDMLSELWERNVIGGGRTEGKIRVGS